MEQNYACLVLCGSHGATHQLSFLLARLYIVAPFLTNHFTDKKIKCVVFLVSPGVYMEYTAEEFLA